MHDVTFERQLQGSDQHNVQTLLHRVTESDALSLPSDFVTLVVSLPLRDFWFDLHDLTLFVLPPETTRQVDGKARARPGMGRRQVFRTGSSVLSCRSNDAQP
ncbi:hypothetical protein [Pararhodobacter sp.]